MHRVHNYIVSIYTDYAIEIFLEELKNNVSTKFFDFIENLNITRRRDVVKFILLFTLDYMLIFKTRRYAYV